MQPTIRLPLAADEDEALERIALRLVPLPPARSRGGEEPGPVALLQALGRREGGAAADRLRTLARSPENARLLRAFARALHQVVEARRDPVEAALAFVEEAGVPAVSTAQAGAVLVVAADGTWFEAPGAPRADLRRRGVLRRFLRALVAQRLLAPGVGLTQQRLVEVGWPGERIRPSAAAARVYTTIRQLRAFGLGGHLRTHADGYLLDPALAVRRADAQPPADV